MARTNIPGARDAGLAKYESEDFAGAPELFFGDTPLPVSTYIANVGPNTNILGWSVVGWAGNVPGAPIVMANWMGELLGGDGSGLVASGALTGSAVGTAGQTFVLGTVTYKLMAAVAAANDVKIGGTSAATAQNIADAINADPDAIAAGTVGPGTVPHPTASASVSGSVVTARANAPGTGGNAIVTTSGATGWAWGGATLAGGTDEGGGGIRPIGITTVNIVTGPGVNTTLALFTSGNFNQDALNWDDSFNTGDKKKQAFIDAPLGTILIGEPKYESWDTGN